MAMNAEWVGLLTAKLVMRRDRLTDAESAAVAIRESITEANDEEARVRGLTAGTSTPVHAETRPSRRPSAQGTVPPKTVQASRKKGDATGLTERVNRVFDDGKTHNVKALATQLGVTSRQMKRAINNLWHKRNVIKHVGIARSGDYVRVASPKAATPRGKA